MYFFQITAGRAAAARNHVARRDSQSTHLLRERHYRIGSALYYRNI